MPRIERSDHLTVESTSRGQRGVNRFIFTISPQTHVRVTKADKIFFQIPEDCDQNCGQPRRKTSKSIGCSHCLSEAGLARKRRIQRYYDYKNELLAFAKLKRFSFPISGAALYFFVPMPKRWSKQKRAKFHMQAHQQKPDLSNLLKAFEDGLIKKDEAIWHYAGMGKYWVDTLVGDKRSNQVAGPGWIEVHLNLPVYDPLKPNVCRN